MARQRPFIGDVGAVFALKAAYAAILFVTSVIVSRGLGPEGRGAYYAPLLAASTVVALCQLGLDQANVYLFGSRRLSISRLIRQSGAVSLMVGAIAGIGLAAAGSMQVSWFAGVPYWMIAAAASTVPFGVHTILASGLLALQGRVTTAPLVVIGVALAQLLALAIIGAAGLFSPGPVFLSAAVTIVVTSLILASTLAPARELIGWDVQLLRQSMAHALVLHIGMALLFLHLRVDMFLVKGFLGTAALGLYSLAVVLAESVMLIADSIGTALTPLQATGTLRQAAGTALRVVRILPLIGGIVILGWAVLGRFLLRLLFGPEFLPVYSPLLILLPGIVLLGMQRVCGPVILRAGRPWAMTGIQACGFLANVILNLWWIRLWGLNGAAAASMLSYTLSATMYLTWTTHLAGESLTAAVPRARDVLQAVASAREHSPSITRTR